MLLLSFFLMWGFLLAGMYAHWQKPEWASGEVVIALLIATWLAMANFWVHLWPHLQARLAG
jgi:hypothetical protein